MTTLIPEVRYRPVWKKAVRKVRMAEKNCRMDIDLGIRETVIALNALGFLTDGSCEGHAHRHMACASFPWVLIISPPAESVRNSHRWVYLANKKVLEEFNLQHVTTGRQAFLSKEERKEFEKLDVFRRSLEQDVRIRIRELLREFYRKRPTPGTPRLALHPNVFFLMPKPALDDYPRYQRGRTRDILRKLKKYQAEIRRFTEFLERKILKS